MVTGDVAHPRRMTVAGPPSMRRAAFVLAGVGAVAGMAAYMAPASGQADGEAAPIFGIRLPPDTAIGG
jgi:hypothetical protein